MTRQKQPDPASSILDGAIRTLKHLRAPVKDYLLAQVGLSAHDLRIFVSGAHVLKLGRQISHNPEIPYDYEWSRIMTPQPIQILNASSTSPALLACHLLVDWLDAGKDFAALVNSPGGNTHGLIWEEDFLLPGIENGKPSHEVPVLTKGHVQTLRFASSQYIYNKEVHVWANHEGAYRGELIVGTVPEPLSARARRVLSGSVENARIQLLVILDNEEVLPFLWNNQSMRFVPGFNSLGITTREP